MDRTTILVIDDNDATRTGLVQLLTLRGYRTTGAANGREGLDCLRRERSVGVIVLDLTMPIADGYWFRDQQRADPSIAHIPLIVFTGSDDAHTNAQMLSGADVLHKPVGVSQLLEMIASLCDAGLAR
jgi:CheY-like chemotaxis protein